MRQYRYDRDFLSSPLFNWIVTFFPMHCSFSFTLVFHRRFRLFVLCLLFAAVFGARAWANSEIFPAEPAAEKTISWKDGYFIINGKPTFISSGEMHYARIPRELWRDRIWRAKQLGFNCVQMYVFWNATEGREGQWDFSDNLDLDAWLTMIQDAGMYAIVRVGPYSCAEWDDGGLPAWLTAKPGMTLRDSGADFDKYAFRHLDQVEKIVARHQINHGGNVIMAQLENEHPWGWGTEDKDPYLHHLVDQARANGLEIPVFLSGEHHGGDPSGNSAYTVGASPWFTTEFWTGWIGKYGNMDGGMLAEKIAGTWKIIAFGGAGYDYYVVHGGTNFGYSGFSHDATYDYSAPIGESGSFNNFYAPAKRAALFTQSFADLLTGSHNDPALATADAPDVRVTARTNPTGGSFIMLDRFGKKNNGGQIAPSASAYTSVAAPVAGATSTRVTVGGLTLPHQGVFQVEAREPRMLLVNVPWTANASFESICANVMLKHTFGTTDYWVCYGQPGDSGEITLQRKDGAGTKTTTFNYPTDETVQEIDLDSGDGHKASFLIMNKALTEKTWLANGKLYIGPSFVLEDGSMEFPVEGGKATIYSDAGKSTVAQPATTAPALPALADWSWRDAATERTGDIDKTWLQSTGPQQMASYDGFQNRYGWYRTTYHADAAGTLSLHFAGTPETKVIFWNGQPVPSLQNLQANAGDNTLSVLVKAEPRTTLYLWTGPIGDKVARGFRGPVSNETAGTDLPVTWKTWHANGSPGTAEQVAALSYDDSAWEPAPDTVGSGNRSWLRATFTLTADQVDGFLDAPGLKKFKNTAWLNGQKLGSLSGDVSKILVAGTNAILVEVNDNRPALHELGIKLWHNSPLSTATWYFHPGLHGLDETPVIGRVTNWDQFLTGEPWQTGDPATPGLPTLWKTSFTWHPTPGMTQTLGLTTDGLKTGHVWLNGHNLGECPQKVPLFVPMPWLKDGANDLVIFDLAGSKPDKVQFSSYETFATQPAAK